MKPTLVMTDIDGTLMPKGDGISDYTRSVLQDMHERGILLCIASGRPLDEVHRSVKSYELGFEPDFVVGMNGGQIRDEKTGNEISQYEMDPATMKTIIEKMWEVPCNISMYKGNLLYCKFVDEIVIYSRQRAGKDTHVVSGPEEFYEGPNHKFMFRTDTPEQCDEIEAYAKSLNIPGVTFFKTQSNLLEVSDSRVHKGAALETICLNHNIDINDTVAFGDASNDDEMLIRAGKGICMKNGLDSTKAISDEVTEYECEQDGLARWLAENIDQ